MKLKGRILAGTVTVALLSSAGFALANTDAGQAIKSWYDGQYAQTHAAVDQNVADYVDQLTPGLEAEYNGLKDGAATAINNKGNTEISRVSTEINKAKQKHIDDVNKAKNAIIEEMGAKFYNEVFLPGYFEIQRTGDEALVQANTDLTAHSALKGEEAVALVTSELNTAKENAVRDLEEAVRIAQEELAGKLDIEEEIATRNLKKQVDWKIDDLRGEVEKIINNLVKKQEEIIVAKASELEGIAKAELDAVISGINN